jgi:predicted enzyme related to lactoylglutathione lyase
MNVRPSLVEFPADDPERACRFWSSLLGAPLAKRTEDEGSGWQTHGPGAQVGVHERGRGPGDSFSLPYFTVDDVDAALERVKEWAAASSTPARGGPFAETPKVVPSGWR